MARRARGIALTIGVGVVAAVVSAWLLHARSSSEERTAAVLVRVAEPLPAQTMIDAARRADLERLVVPASAPAAPPPASDAAASAPPEPAEDFWHLAVVDEARAPAPGAIVEVWPDAAEAVGQDARALDVRFCDALGHCVLPALTADGALSVRDDHAGTSGILSGRGLAQRAARSREIAIVLQPLAHLAGRVVSHEGRPVPDAVVHVDAWSASSLRGEPALPREFAAAPDGTFDLPCDAGNLMLSATAASFAVADGTPIPTRTFEVELVAGDSTSVELRFPARWILAGDVIDTDGKAVPKVELALWQPRAVDAPVAEDLPEEELFFADAAGHFEVALMSAGEWGLMALTDAYAPGSPVFATLPEDGGRVNLTLVLLRPSSIRGFVRDEVGRAVAGAWLLGQPTEEETRRLGRQPGSLASTTHSEADGSFVLEQLAPQWEYFVSCTTTSSITRKEKEAYPPVPAGTTDLVRTVHVRPRDRVVRGRVIAAGTGRPIAGASLAVVTMLGDGPSPVTMSSPSKERTDTDGAFVLAGLEAEAALAIEASAPGYAPARSEALPIPPEGRDVLIELPEPGRLLVNLRTADGRPAAFVPVRLRTPEPRDVGREFSDAEGRAAFEGLAPGPLEVSVFLRRDTEPAWTPVEIRAGALATLDLTVVLPTAASPR